MGDFDCSWAPFRTDEGIFKHLHPEAFLIQVFNPLKTTRLQPHLSHERGALLLKFLSEALQMAQLPPT